MGMYVFRKWQPCHVGLSKWYISTFGDIGIVILIYLRNIYLIYCTIPEIWFYQRKLKIAGAAHVSSYNVASFTQRQQIFERSRETRFF